MAHPLIKKSNRMILAMSLVGILLCLYTLSVEKKMHKNADYKPFCDINEHISCTKVFMSKESKGLGIMPLESVLNLPNAIYGLMFYSLMALLTLSDNYRLAKIQLIFSFLSVASCVHLAYILFLLRDFCIVCVGMYIVNGVLFLFSYRKHNVIKYLEVEECHCD